MKKHQWIISFVAFMCFSIALEAQYFGRNKPRYRDFDFEVYQTPNFDMYHYLRNPDKVDELGHWSEMWYHMHQDVLHDTIRQHNPILFYNDHADFQQTNAISGSIGVGTGGVTEAFKNRVVMPLTLTNQQTNHVLGHELVHAFQYNMVIQGDSSSLQNLQNLPLWMVEGLAEYLSLGRHDANTAMWMRDAVVNERVPTLKDLRNPKYFPYRYGQAFWSFLTGKYGDDVIKPYFMMTARIGMIGATQLLLGMEFDSLSNEFKSTLEDYYEPLVGKNKRENVVGRKLISEDNSGRMNLSPVVSPDGKYVIFLSEKDLISTDLYLASTRDGKIIRKVVSTVKDGHLDHLNYLESSGTWSPDSKKFAFVAFKKGRNTMLIKEALTGKTLEEFSLKDLPAFSNPAWSPDGRSIVVAGLNNGNSDLYQIDLRTKNIKKLTNDKYSAILPNWNEDGTKIIFSSDRLSVENGRTHGKWVMNLSELDVVNGTIKDYDFFPGSDNINPEYDHEGNIYFLSDRDGYRNLYRYKVDSDELFQMTNLKVGISGITQYSPAISVSKKRDQVLYSGYFDSKYTIYRATTKSFKDAKLVDRYETNFEASTLPIVGRTSGDRVNENLEAIDARTKLAASTGQYKRIDYKPQFKLDYLGGSTGVGVGTSNAFGTQTGLAGGVDMLFSDILGNNQLYAGLSLNGEIYDAGGVFQYINRKNRLAWGAALSHIPYRTGYSQYLGLDTLSSQIGDILVDNVETNLLRIFEDGISIFAHYPFSVTQRIEASLGTNYRYFRWDRFNNYYDAFGRLIAQDREKVPIEGDLNLGGIYIRKALSQNANFAYVSDNSYFGLTSPLAGHRYRIGVEKFFGGYDYHTFLLDLRKYQRLNPVTLAFRIMHYARYGNDANNFYPIFLGQMGMVHGYTYGKQQEIFERYDLSFNQISGSKMLLGNFEVRLPFTGPEGLAVIKSKMLFTELNFFVDGGVAYNDFDDFDIDEDVIVGRKPTPIFSTGIGLRVNLFGALIIEPYYAFPIQKNTKGVLGINLVPGW